MTVFCGKAFLLGLMDIGQLDPDRDWRNDEGQEQYENDGDDDQGFGRSDHRKMRQYYVHGAFPSVPVASDGGASFNGGTPAGEDAAKSFGFG